MAEPVVDEAEVVPTSGDASTSSGESPAITDDLLRLRGFLERSDVDGAREFVKELEQRWPDSDRVQYFARVLAPPVWRPAPDVPNRSFRRENEWLRVHAREYPGCWIAVFEDRFIAADPDLGVVLLTARQALGTDTALLHYQPGQPK